MKRQIKFRVWSQNCKKFIENFEVDAWCESGIWLNHVFQEKDFVFQQFTGLTDSAGKEIFEGDIFRLGNSIVEVIFENGYFALKHKSGLLMLVFNELDLLSEILGNVFENPELLKK